MLKINCSLQPLECALAVPRPSTSHTSDALSHTSMFVPLLALSAGFMAPSALPRTLAMSKVTMGEGGKGFGGGEATRDPEPTNVDPNDPKGKQQAIHKAEARTQHSNPRFLPRTFAAYLALPLQTVKGHAFESHARSHSPSIWPRDPQHQRQMALVLRRVTTRAPGCRPLRRRRSRRPLMP